MNNGKRTLKNICSSLVLQLITIICGFIIPKLIISAYGSEVNGLINSITQFLSYIVLLESGIGPVIKASLYKPIVQKNKKELANIIKSSEKFFRNISKIFIIYILILCFLYPLLVNSSFDYAFTISLLLIISISTFMEYYFGITYKLFLQANQENYIISYIQIITTILNTISIIILVKLNLSIQIVKLVSSIIFVLRPLITNIYFHKKYKIDLLEYDENYKLEQKWDGFAQHIASVIHSNTDIMVLTIFENILEVSVYAVYNLVISGLRKIVDALASGIDSLFGNMLAKEEHEKLNENFRLYQAFYYTIINTMFSMAFVLVVPFVRLYTKGVTDVNYIRPLFAILIILSEYINSLKKPYASIIISAGHFRQTQRGAWIEALTNLLLSIILVNKCGIIGIAIGTVAGMGIRLIDYILYCSKNIINYSLSKSIKYNIINFLEIITITILFSIINVSINSYFEIILYATIVGIVSFLIIYVINLLIYPNEMNNLISLLLRRRR